MEDIFLSSQREQTLAKHERHLKAPKEILMKKLCLFIEINIL